MLMIRRSLVLACCALIFAAPAFAQSTPAASKSDALTGTWVGELSPKNVDQPVKVTLELKFDGKKAVTGTIKGMPNPGDVKAGTFDPKTGALRLELGRTDAATVLLLLEGKVVKGTATGQISGDTGDGTFKLSKKV
jgi:hypothetical protein